MLAVLMLADTGNILRLTLQNKIYESYTRRAKNRAIKKQ